MFKDTQNMIKFDLLCEIDWAYSVYYMITCMYGI